MGVRLVRRWGAWLGFAVWLFLDGWTGLVHAQQEQLDVEQTQKECEEGVTIYCLALGMAAEREGHREQALEFYRRACVNHPTPGHLRACTPLLSLASQMGRLSEEARPLEAKCEQGHDHTCFYLGKEYLKVGALNQAIRLLVPLCRDDYQPPDANDYGACYHMARGYERNRNYDRAEELFELDCRRNPEQARASCDALRRVGYVRKKGEEAAWSRVQEFHPLEIALIVLVATPVVGTWLWSRNRPWAWHCLRVGPVIAGICFVLWELAPKAGDLPPSDRIVSVLSFLSVIGLAAMAHQKLQDREDERKRGASGTSPPSESLE